MRRVGEPSGVPAWLRYAAGGQLGEVVEHGAIDRVARFPSQDERRPRPLGTMCSFPISR